jgi:hypothetical protein
VDENPYKAPQATELHSQNSQRATMTPQDIFGIVVRSAGVITITYSAWGFVGIVVPSPDFSRADYLVSFIPTFVIGCVLTFAADTIVNLAYRPRRISEEDSSDDR